MAAPTRIALLSTSDTDLLSARASGAAYVWANPSRTSLDELVALATGVDLVVLRLLGSPQQYEAELVALRGTGHPLVVLGGELTPSAELMEASTVPVGVAAQAHRYLAEGGPRNLGQLHAFLSDTVLLTGEGFEEPEVIPAWGVLEREPAPTSPAFLIAMACIALPALAGVLVAWRKRHQLRAAVR